ncbi:hypothetical protein, partial [Herminiimonas sp. CN]|uniref:hypothetical protein n=1 Tax=Herminiimonas sp. CN TaxID=1349818 RepID=UPI00138E1CD8
FAAAGGAPAVPPFLTWRLALRAAAKAGFRPERPSARNTYAQIKQAEKYLNIFLVMRSYFSKLLILNELFIAIGLSILLKPASLLTPQAVKWGLSTKLSTVVVDRLKKSYETDS